MTLISPNISTTLNPLPPRPKNTLTAFFPQIPLIPSPKISDFWMLELVLPYIQVISK
jgi:hypothetical protein